MRARFRKISLSIAGGLILLVMLAPVLWLVSASLQDGVSAATVELIPSALSFSGYVQAAQDQGGSLLTSLLISLGTSAVTVSVAAPAAFGLSKLTNRFVDVMLLVLFVAQIVPGIVITNSLYTVFVATGLLNSVLGLIIANASMTLPFAILLLRAFLRELDPEVLEAARIDGASHIRSFVAIVLPLSRNALITVAIFGFLAGWGDFLFALTLSTGAELRPLTIGIYQYLSSPNVPWNTVMATGVIAAVPAIALLLALQRHLRAGLAAGSGR